MNTGLCCTQAKIADRGKQVVQNFAANVALCIGASPIMANYGEEAADLAKLGGALVINMGTVTPEGLENYKKALRAYNAALRPVVFDPVGYVQHVSVVNFAAKSSYPADTYQLVKRRSHIRPTRGRQGDPRRRLHHGDQGQRERDQDHLRQR